MIQIEIPGPPQGKGRPRFRVVKTKAGATFGNAYTPSATRKYEAEIQKAAVKAMAGRTPLDGPVAVDLIAEMPIPPSWTKAKKAAAANGTKLHTSKPDWENIAKVLDALNGVVWVDDSQVVDGRVRKVYSATPRLLIEVRPA